MSNRRLLFSYKKKWHIPCVKFTIQPRAFAFGPERREVVVSYPNKRETIQEILKETGCLHWYVAQPDKQNPASANAKCILLNFVEKKRAELIIPTEWFQDPRRYGQIIELIWLAVQNSTPVKLQRAAHSLFSFPRQPNQNGNRGEYKI